MTVEQHLMKYNKDGELVDDEDDTEDTPEKSFAKTLTDNYNLLAKRFPIFGRLNPLMKLSAISLILNNIYQGFEASVRKDPATRQIK